LLLIVSHKEQTDETGLPEFAFVLIPGRPGSMQVGKGTITINRPLDAITSKQVVQTVASYYSMYRKFNENLGKSDEQVLDTILDDLKNLYSIDNPLYAGWSQEQRDILASSDQSYIYANDESRKLIKDGAKKYINSLKYIEQFESDDVIEDENVATSELGNDQPSTGFDNRAENKGGFTSLPKILREFIGFTTYEKTDEFGNREVKAGVPIVGTIDSLSVYYGLLRTLANVTDPVKFFQKMVRYGDNNEQSRAFISRFITESGLDTNILFTEDRIEATKNTALVEMVRKGFNKYRIDYIFTEVDINKRSSKSYPANRRNVEKVQFDSWANSFIAGYVEHSDESQKAIRRSISDVGNRWFHPLRNIKYNGNTLDQATFETQNALRNVGITVSRDYVKYSLLAFNAKKFDTLNDSYKKQGTELQFEDPQNQFITREDYKYVQIMKVAEEQSLTSDLFEQLAVILNSGNNPFFKEITTETKTTRRRYY
jgi:hypothetical protein